MRGWKDLHLILMKFMEFDIHMKNESEVFENLVAVGKLLRKIEEGMGCIRRQG